MSSVGAVLSELIAHRELGFALTYREVVVRYKRSALGLVWALAEPLFTAFVLVILFGVILKANHDIGNYSFFVLFGTLPWLFFSSTLEQCGLTLLEHAPLIRKVYFPRELVVIAVVASRLSSLVVGLVFGLLLAVIPGIADAPLDWSHIALIPVGVVLATMLSLGCGLFLSALQVVLQDSVFLARFALRLAFYGTPIVYATHAVPQVARPFFDMNPLVGVMWLFQSGVTTGVDPPSTIAWVSSLAVPPLSLLLGWWGFRKLGPIVSDLL